jgi:two-component system, OmpR family, sensor histidine kinase BaeS
VLGPLGVRIAFAFVVVALAAIAVLGTLTLVASQSEVEGLADRQREQSATEIAAALAQAYDEAGGWAGADLQGAFTLATSARADLVVLDAEGRRVAVPPSAMAELSEHMHGEREHGRQSGRAPASRVVVRVDGDPVGIAELRFPETRLAAPEREVRDTLARTVVVGAGLAALVALVAAVFVSRRVTRPIAALTGAARRLEAGDRDARVGMGHAPGELGELATAFDQMAVTLRQQDDLRRTLVADVAHELRTPTTILRASFEELVDGLAEATPGRLSSLHDEVLRLGRVVEDLEALASAQAAGLHLERAPFDLAGVAAEAAEGLRPRFEDAGITLAVTTSAVTVDGDAGRLRQVVGNLLTNALKFTPPGGAVRLVVGAADGVARLEVSDTGPGIPDDEQAHIFERFWRGTNAERHAGSGIGLAVVAELVDAHDGRVAVDSAPGQGSTFTVLLPSV